MTLLEVHWYGHIQTNMIMYGNVYVLA